jgi:hypothetical protein
MAPIDLDTGKEWETNKAEINTEKIDYDLNIPAKETKKVQQKKERSFSLKKLFRAGKAALNTKNYDGETSMSSGSNLGTGSFSSTDESSQLVATTSRGQEENVDSPLLRNSGKLAFDESPITSESQEYNQDETPRKVYKPNTFDEYSQFLLATRPPSQK